MKRGEKPLELSAAQIAKRLDVTHKTLVAERSIQRLIASLSAAERALMRGDPEAVAELRTLRPFRECVFR